MSEIENVRVFVRIRPENSEFSENCLNYDLVENLISVKKTNENGNSGGKIHKYDKVFHGKSTQIQLYQHIAGPIVEKVLNGYNGTIFAYGQTGTGKTYTMCGNFENPDEKGITPNAFAHIFAKISESDQRKSFVVTATYLEIYNEEVRDLLSSQPEKKLQIKERPDVGIYVKDLMGFTVHSQESILELLRRGNKNRVTRQTLMNDVSSRSHAIFTVTIEMKNCENIDQLSQETAETTNRTVVGKLNLVDLAGSERASRTGATGERLREASNINLSLSVLGNVISALVDGKNSHIPYRNSKLTRLLQDSLGGNSKTAMIAMISPERCDAEETACTLRYAARVKQIKNYAKINIEHQNRGLIEGFEREIAELKAKITELNDATNFKIRHPSTNKKTTQEDEKLKKEFEKTETEKKDLEQKIALIQKKILVGGLTKLSETAERQNFELNETIEELNVLDQSHRILMAKLDEKAAENLDFKEKHATLREEEEALTRKIRKIQGFLNEFKEELRDKEHDYQREMEQLYDNNRLLMRESQLAALLLDNYVPMEYREKIELNLVWNMESQEFQMRGVAYTGNNMRKHKPNRNDLEVSIKAEIRPQYHKYAEKKREKTRVLEKKTFSAKYSK